MSSIVKIAMIAPSASIVYQFFVFFWLALFLALLTAKLKASWWAEFERGHNRNMKDPQIIQME